MSDVIHDFMSEYRNRKDIGWDAVAEVYQRSFPKEEYQFDSAQYCGVLYGLAAALHPKVIVEIGAQYGLSTRMFLAATERTEGVVHSYDIDPKCAEMLLGPRWCFHLGRSQDIQPIACDLLYVDGDHGYEAVCSDMARHGPLVRDGGLVILDDYFRNWPGKVRWVDERWDVLDPIIIGPTAVVRVTPVKREIFGKVFP